jgi:site-specific DNA recombinase
MESPEIQERAIRTFIENRSMTEGVPWAVAETISDLDESGRSFAREGIKRAIKGVKDGTWNVIVCYNYSRLGRNAIESQLAIAEVEETGGSLLSATEPFETESSVGQFNRSTLLAIAQLQSDTISDSWKAAQSLRLSRGLPAGGNSRWGYDYHNPKPGKPCQQGCEPGTCQVGYVPNAEFGPVLAQCYRKFIQGDGMLKVTNWLNSEGFPTTRGRLWAIATVSRMLDSGFGAGKVIHKDPNDPTYYVYSPGAHSAVITPEEWDAYLVARDLRSPKPSRSKNPRWALAGIAKCSQCGGGLNAVRTKMKEGKESRLVRCSRMSTSGKHRCTGVYIDVKALDDAAMVILRQWAGWINALTESFADQRPLARQEPDAEEKEVRRLKARYASLNEQVERLTDAFQRGVLPLEDFAERRTKALEEAEQTRLRVLEIEGSSRERPDPVAALEILEKWSTIAPERRNRILASLIHRVIVYPGSIPDPSGFKKRLRLSGPRIFIETQPALADMPTTLPASTPARGKSGQNAPRRTTRRPASKPQG